MELMIYGSKMNRDEKSYIRYEHIAITDEKCMLYCRAVNAVIDKNNTFCKDCPLYVADVHKTVCLYYDVSGNEELSPCEAAKRTEELIKEGITKDFPEFVNTEDEGMIIYERALQYAAMAHRGINRKSTKIPYIAHPIEASSIVRSMTEDREIMAAAALHDVIEDTKYTYEDILNEFGRRIADLVQCESENKRKDMKAESTWLIRKTEFLEHLSKAPTEAKMISLADKLSNIRSIYKDYERIGDKVWERFNQKDKSVQGWYYFSVAEKLEEFRKFKVYDDYVTLCHKVFD